jgi:transcriptional regulator with XRE-family HTH domain
MTRWREANGISQTAASEMAGVSQASWSDWENGKKRPQIEQALRLAHITGGAVPVEAWAPPPEAANDADPPPAAESGEHPAAGETPTGTGAA